MTAELLVIDNYDSFTYNLVQMFRCYDLEIAVHRADRITVAEAAKRRADYILISPGPRAPSHAGISTELIRVFYRQVPILGVCLGMQCINEVFGGETLRAALPMHGKTSRVSHRGESVFSGLASPFRAARYHSLVTRPAEDSALNVSALSDDGVVMGLYHPRHPLHGVQFHPESFMTEQGYALIENFLRLGPLENPRQIKQVSETFAFGGMRPGTPETENCRV